MVTRGQPTQTAVGNFADALTYDWRQGLIDERGTYARRIGFVNGSATLLTGSSGGFTDGYSGGVCPHRRHHSLLGARGRTRLTVDSRDLDVSGGHVTNRAIPCYYAACGLGPPVDPPGTYKPCLHASVRMQESETSCTGADVQTRSVQIDLLDSQDAVLSSTTDMVSVGPEQMEAVIARSVMLPSTPGVYRLRAQIVDDANVQIDSASLALRIR